MPAGGLAPALWRGGWQNVGDNYRGHPKQTSPKMTTSNDEGSMRESINNDEGAESQVQNPLAFTQLFNLPGQVATTTLNKLAAHTHT